MHSPSASPHERPRTQSRSPVARAPAAVSRNAEVVIPIHDGALLGAIETPTRAVGAVVFVHGSGVTRLDERAALVARQFRRAGLCTVQVDLLQRSEAGERHNVFDTELQAQRLAEVATWLSTRLDTAHLPIGYYATGVGAAAALLAAARNATRPAAIVVRDGRPDQALFWLPRVAAPTLFIVDETAGAVRQQAEAACARLAGEHGLVVVRAQSAFADGKPRLDSSAATAWFLHYMRPEQRADARS